jgi:hypothetical protein
MKINAGSLFVALGLGLSTALVVTGVTGCADDQQSSNLKGSPPYTKPTWSGDDHVPPVYTSPAVSPASTNLSVENPPP